jgi:7-cyano-7-deazaguanine synthase in queuosine biosynthesis
MPLQRRLERPDDQAVGQGPWVAQRLIGSEMGHGIPVTYVPARNTIFLSFALAWAESLRSEDIFIG